MSALEVRRSGYALGASITGVDASKKLDDATIAAIRQAWIDNVIVVLPGQNLEPEAFRDFCAQFGELDVLNVQLLPHLPNLPEVVVRSSKPAALDGKETAKSPPADYWHADFSHMVRPSTITFLHGKELPQSGGDTMFASLYAAYDSLSPAMQALVEKLEAVHAYRPSLHVQHSPERLEQYRRLKPPVVQPVVRVHPDTGRKALYITARVRNFVGFTEEESKPIIDFLIAHATRYEFVYRHRWTSGDVIIWDNRCSLHYAVRNYSPDAQRLLLRASLNGPATGRVLGEEGAAEKVAAS